MVEKKVIFGLVFGFILLFGFVGANSVSEDLELVERGLEYNIYKNLISGSNVLRLHPGPINYNNGIEYLPIDTTIVQEGCEYDYCVREGIYYADFKEDSLSEYLVKFYYNNSYVIYAPLDLKYISEEGEKIISSIQKTKGYSNGSKFIYPNFYGEGLNINYEYKNTLLKEELVIENRESLIESTLGGEKYLSLDFKIDSKFVDKQKSLKEVEIYVSGKVVKFSSDDFKAVEEKDLKWNKEDKLKIKGKVDFKNFEEEFLFKIPVPYAVDSNGSFVELEYVLEKKGEELFVSILTPYDWLMDEERVFPVRIDPTLETGYLTDVSMHGTVIHESGGDYDFWDENTDSNFYVGSVVDNEFRAYVSFSSNAIQDLTYLDNYIDEIEFNWDVVTESGSSYMRFYELDEDDPDDLTPDTQSEMSDLFDEIDDNSYLGQDSYPSVGSNSFDLDRDDTWAALLNAYDYDERFILGIKGECCNEGVITSKGAESSGEPYLEIRYSDGSCGNGYVDIGVGEECDDDDTSSGDGCSSSCQIESGWTCSGEPSTCTEIPVCGDGEIEGTEECDDGDTSSGDGCSSTCQIESGWVCNGEPSDCYETCTIPDGSSNDGGCDCDGPSDCPSGYFCDEGSGYDACEELPTCVDGVFNVFVGDSFGNPIEDTYVYFESVSQGQTDSDGYKEVSVPSDYCGEQKTIQIKCSDDSTVCGVDYGYVDENGDVDSLNFVCDVCAVAKDLYLESNDLSFIDQSGQTNISAIIHTVGITASNVDIKLIKMCGGSHSSSTTVISSIGSSNNYVISFLEDLSNCEKVGIHVDPDDEVDEDEAENNYAVSFVIDPLNVYLEVDSGYASVDSVITNYVGEFAQLTTQGDSQLEIYIGRNADIDTIKEEGWLVGNVIEFNGQREGVPYNGLIVKDIDGAKPKLYVFGNEIDGTIAAVRKLIEERVNYLNENSLDDNLEGVYLGEEDIGAISVYDYLHTDENQANYRKGNVEFGEIVDNVLRRKTFNLAIKRVLTSNDNTSLRMKHINSELSPTFREFSNERPVVLGHGLFENLFSMEEFALKIAKDEAFDGKYVRDTWLIELTGGSNTECDDCPNYGMDDLVDYYWPALIGGVLKYSDKSEVDYIGYDLGGGVGIRSYEKYYGGSSEMGYYVNENDEWESFDLPEDFVDHMALIDPLLAFNGDTMFTKCIDRYGDNILFDDLKNFSHVTSEQIVMRLLFSSGTRMGWVFNPIPSYDLDPDYPCMSFATLMYFGSKEDSKISSNIWFDIVGDVQNKTNSNPFLSSINELLIIESKWGENNNNLFVPFEDLQNVYENSNANEKYLSEVSFDYINLYVPIWINKYGLYNPLNAKFLNDKPYSPYDKYVNYNITEEI